MGQSSESFDLSAMFGKICFILKWVCRSLGTYQVIRRFRDGFFHLIYLLSEFHFPQFWLVRCTTASSHLSHQLNITYENLKNAVIKTYNAYASSGYAFLHSPIVADPLIAYQIATKLVPEDECLCNEHRRFSTWNSIRVGNWIYLEGAEG